MIKVDLNIFIQGVLFGLIVGLILVGNLFIFNKWEHIALISILLNVSFFMGRINLNKRKEEL
jgi:hypothetical protein